MAVKKPIVLYGGKLSEIHAGDTIASSSSILILSYSSKSTNYTIVPSTDYTIDCTNTITITLPTAIGITGQIFVIKNSGTGIITVNTTSSQTIDGGLTAELKKQYTSITVQSTGSNWIIQ